VGLGCGPIPIPERSRGRCCAASRRSFSRSRHAVISCATAECHVAQNSVASGFQSADPSAATGRTRVRDIAASTDRARRTPERGSPFWNVGEEMMHAQRQSPRDEPHSIGSKIFAGRRRREASDPKGLEPGNLQLRANAKMPATTKGTGRRFIPVLFASAPYGFASITDHIAGGGGYRACRSSRPRLRT
jgi:hypothetical protein